MNNILNSLPLVQRKIAKERAPLYRKWRAIPISSIKRDGDLFWLIPNPELTDVTREELNCSLTHEELDDRVPSTFFLDGGWVLFAGEYPSEFLSDKLFREKLEFIETSVVEITMVVNTFLITNINLTRSPKLKAGDPDFIEVTTEGEIKWKVQRNVANALKMRVGDLLTYDGMRQIDVIHQTDIKTDIDDEEVDTGDVFESMSDVVSVEVAEG